MNIVELNRDAQNCIYEHNEANEYASRFDHVNYDVNGGRDFTIIGYNYDEEGILDYTESKKFTY